MTTMYLDLIGGPARSRDDIIADILQNCPVDTREEAEAVFEGALDDGQLVPVEDADADSDDEPQLTPRKVSIALAITFTLIALGKVWPEWLMID